MTNPLDCRAIRTYLCEEISSDWTDRPFISHEGIAVAWECLFIFDSMIFSLTVYKSYKEGSSIRIGTVNDLVTLIARDGTWSMFCNVDYLLTVFFTGAIYFA